MRKLLWGLFEVVESLAIALVAVFIVRTFVAQPFLVSGASMEPNFHDGDYLLIDEITPRFREPQRGEVLVFKYPGDHAAYYIKRVIGLPTETVRIENGTITVMNKEKGTQTLAEHYETRGGATNNFSVTLQEQEYFMMGDNRNFSYDSRSWGPLDAKKIVGLVRFRLWPIHQVMAFEAPSYTIRELSD